MKLIAALLTMAIGMASLAAPAQSPKSAKWDFFGGYAGRLSPVNGKALSTAGLLYEAHYDDVDFFADFNQSFGSADLRVTNYTFGYAKSLERNEGPTLRIFAGAGISSILVSGKDNFDGVQSTVGFDICPPMKVMQICGRFNMRFLDSEFASKSSQEISIVLKKMSFK